MIFVPQKPHRAFHSRHSALMSREMPDHDLPVLATRESPAVMLDWEPLLAAGVQPALILGAERRWQGRR